LQWTLKKSKPITSWPQPVIVKQLKGFLGLAGYYRKFTKNNGAIDNPLRPTQEGQLQMDRASTHILSTTKAGPIYNTSTTTA
jgi:hypothetical protein